MYLKYAAQFTLNTCSLNHYWDPLDPDSSEPHPQGLFNSTFLLVFEFQAPTMKCGCICAYLLHTTPGHACLRDRCTWLSVSPIHSCEPFFMALMKGPIIVPGEVLEMETRDKAAVWCKHREICWRPLGAATALPDTVTPAGVPGRVSRHPLLQSCLMPPLSSFTISVLHQQVFVHCSERTQSSHDLRLEFQL